jgi:cytidylate kinase
MKRARELDPAQDSPQIAIDGPAGSGKSTLAARVAQQLGFVHVDTGAMYRALTLIALREGIDAADAPGLAERLRSLDLSFEEGRLQMNREDVAEAIRSEEVTARVSEISAHLAVRRAMVQRQRKLCRHASRGAVLEGRDIGSVVLPLARCKIYLDADLAERARRRLLQIGAEATEARVADMAREIERRDRSDSERENSPLLISPDAHVIDTTSLSIEEVVERVIAIARDSFRAPASRQEVKPYRYRKSTFAWAQRLIRLVYFRPCGMRVYGRANQAVAEALVYASNHISHFDPPVAGSGLDRELHFLAKRELFVGLFGRIISYFNSIPIHRGRWDETAFSAAVEVVRSGQSLMFFPEGTRKPSGRPGPAKRGLGILLQRTSAPMVPVFVRGTDQLRRCLLRRARLEVWIGPPLRLHALDVLSRTMSNAAVQQRIGKLWLACIQELAERSEEAAG